VVEAGTSYCCVDVAAFLASAIGTGVDTRRLGTIPAGGRFPTKTGSSRYESAPKAATARGGNIVTRLLPVLVRQKIARLPKGQIAPFEFDRF